MIKTLFTVIAMFSTIFFGLYGVQEASNAAGASISDAASSLTSVTSAFNDGLSLFEDFGANGGLEGAFAADYVGN